jgi:hypothetical protein
MKMFLWDIDHKYLILAVYNLENSHKFSVMKP